MANSFILKIADLFIKPKQWYEYSGLTIEGFCFIGNKDDQKNAGYIRKTPKPANEERKRKFGMNPVKPYRDYYGKFTLKTKLLPGELEVLFALGYTMNQKVVTVDDYSNFSWLRLATGLNDIIYPNLAHQKQLLDYLMKHSKYSKFVISRVYHYLEFALLHELMAEVLKREK
jgi:hypothetical protein